ncbi:MAG: magnesium/cobalt transporter CorA [Myxococcales bacterium]|nr:magnesium/cobalt transporter CorA [Myxococcales bacterium]
METGGGARISIWAYADGRLRAGGAELLEAPGIKWIDLTGPDEPTLRVLAHRFGLHTLALEDCLHLDQRPKLEEYPGHHFIVLQSFSTPADKARGLSLVEMHFFLGSEFLITVHAGPTSAVDQAKRRVEEDAPGTIGRGPDFVLYLVADALVDLNFPPLDAIAEELEELETRVFRLPDQRQLQRAFDLKRDLVVMRRVLSPQRDVVALLAKRALPIVSERTALYFRDVYDHLVRVYEQIESARDLLSNVMDAYLSVVANRTNDISKQLTIFATIFLPLSFITGFFGQNFDVLSGKSFFVLMLALTGLLPAGMLYWFRWRKWL